MRKLIELDPMDYHVPKGATEGRLFEAMGLIPAFLMNMLEDEAPTLLEGIKGEYGFPLNHFEGPVVDKATGEYKYPDDPTQYPIARINWHNGDIAYFYPHAMIVFFKEDSDEAYCSRID